MKCKDFFIFRVRYYADRNLLRKCKENDPLPLQHQERAEEFIKFFWNFVQYVTGRNSTYYHILYMFEAQECVQEQLWEKYGMRFIKGEGTFTILIPTNPGYHVAIEWLKKNVKLPYKICTKINLGSLRYNKNFNIARNANKKFISESVATKEIQLKLVEKYGVKLEVN